MKLGATMSEEQEEDDGRGRVV